MKTATYDDVAMWGCLVISNLSTELWQTLLFGVIGVGMMCVTIYRDINE